MRYALALILTAGIASATVRTAASTSRADVGTAYAACVAGDTLSIPAGTSVWTSGLTIDKALIIDGAGRGLTNISHGMTGSKFINWTTQATGEHVIRDISFSYTSGTIDNYGNFQFQGSTPQLLIERCDFTSLIGEVINTYGGVYGVIADCTFTLGTNSRVLMGQNGTSSYGDSSWNTAANFGTDDFMFVEYCTITQPGAEYSFYDSWFGGRAVIRYNTVTNCHIETHGTESGGRARGARALEIYNNTITLPSPSNGFIVMRGGGAVIHNNTLVGTESTAINLTDYRAFHNFAYWGLADGTKEWDVNDVTDGAGTPGGAGDGVFESGTATGGGDSSLTDSGKSWSTSGGGQWKGYTLRQKVALTASSGGSNTVTVTGPAWGATGRRKWQRR